MKKAKVKDDIFPMTVSGFGNTFWLKRDDVVELLNQFAATEEFETRGRIEKLARNIEKMKLR